MEGGIGNRSWRRGEKGEWKKEEEQKKKSVGDYLVNVQAVLYTYTER